MKKNKITSFLILSIVCTTGCDNNTSSSSTIMNSSSSSSHSTSSLKDSSSTSSTSSSTVIVIDKELEEKLGTVEKLKNLLEDGFAKTTEITYASTKFKTNTIVNAKRKSKEILVNETSDGNSSFYYIGLINDYLYEINDSNQQFTKKLVYNDEDISISDYDKMSKTEAIEKINYSFSEHMNLTETTMWGNLFREGVEGTYYHLAYAGKNIAIQFETYYVVKYGEDISAVYKYSLAALLDSSFNLKEGTYTQYTYRSDNYDKTTGRPLDGATPNSSESVSVIDLVYDNIEETTSTPMIDFTPYSVSALTNEANINSKYLDRTNWNYIFSDKNVAWLGSDLLLNIEDPDTKKPYYLPTTALNANDLCILSSSNESLIYNSENDYGQIVWTVTSDTSAIGQTVELAVGFPNEKPIATIAVTIDEYVGKEEVETTSFETTPYIYSGQNCIYDENTQTLNITSLTTPIYIKFNAPNQIITDYEVYGYYMTNSSISPNYPIEIEFSMQTANEQSDYSGLWLKITPVAIGNVNLTICDMPSMMGLTGEPTDLIKIKINVQ